MHWLANTLFQQHKRRLYTGTSLDGQYQNQIDCILCSQRWRSSIWSAKTILGAVVQIMNSLLQNSDLKKVGKTTKPFRYDLNKIPYNYTVEVEDSQFLIIRLMSSLGSLRRRKGSGALKEEIEVWNSQGEGKDKGLFSLYIS